MTKEEKAKNPGEGIKETRPVVWYEKSLGEMTKDEQLEWIKGLDVDNEAKEELRRGLGLVKDGVKSNDSEEFGGSI